MPTFAERFAETSPVWQNRKKREDEEKAIQYQILRDILQTQPQTFDTESLNQAVQDISQGRGLRLPGKKESTFLDLSASGPATEKGELPIARQQITNELPGKFQPKTSVNDPNRPVIVTEEISKETGLPPGSTVPFHFIKYALDSKKTAAAIEGKKDVAKIQAEAKGATVAATEAGKNIRQDKKSQADLVKSEAESKSQLVRQLTVKLTAAMANPDIPDEEKAVIAKAITIMNETGEPVSYEKVKQTPLKEFFSGSKFEVKPTKKVKKDPLGLGL